MSLTLTSQAFSNQGTIPPQYTCEGKNVNPQLAWSGVPKEARSLALIVDDPDAPDPTAPKTIWTHWVLYNLPAKEGELPAEAKATDLPPGTLEGTNDWKRTGYGGPCPPIGRHRYYFRLFALNLVLPDLGRPTRAKLLASMEGHVVVSYELMGTYEKARKS
ncbi:MAG TPA: YbhB/YbcL family Raf kinase inhibitor-like protein [Gemmatimonadales bacterium]|nr:YbhB/YbcL family Raf kinase inhibitor-like protein [Gemmatimonadales bacterium]